MKLVHKSDTSCHFSDPHVQKRSETSPLKSDCTAIGVGRNTVVPTKKRRAVSVFQKRPKRRSERRIFRRGDVFSQKGGISPPQDLSYSYQKRNREESLFAKVQ